jgi:hypothetical protein
MIMVSHLYFLLLDECYILGNKLEDRIIVCIIYGVE